MNDSLVGSVIRVALFFAARATFGRNAGCLLKETAMKICQLRCRNSDVCRGSRRLWEPVLPALWLLARLLPTAQLRLLPAAQLQLLLARLRLQMTAWDRN